MSETRGADFEQSLVRRTLDGIEQKPVYDRAADAAALGLPGQAPFRRGSRFDAQQSRPWQICSRVDAGTPEQANRLALEELAGGADALWLVTKPATKSRWLTNSAAAQLLAGVQTELIALHLDAGAAAPVLAESILAEVDARGQAAASRLHVGCDPLAALAQDGRLPCSVEAAHKLAFHLLSERGDLPQLRVFRADGLVAHAAGASEAVEIGVVLGSMAEWLRAGESAGAEVAEVAARMDLRVGVAREVFLEIAKVRALRELWSRMLQVCGVPDSDQPGPFVHAVGSPRTLTRRDPWTNLLRGTTQGFAAAVAGADAVSLLPMDAAFQQPGKLSRRMARNTQLVLAEEGHLGQICDPAGGSFAIERWTDDLVEAGWEFFQELESRGGLESCLKSGWLADRLADTRERRLVALSVRSDAVTGVSEYPVLDQVMPEPGDGASSESGVGFDATASPSAWTDALQAVAAAEEVVTIEPLRTFRDAAVFEELRDAADRYRDKRGRRPTVYLATLGALAHHNARVGFARNLFAVGGFDVVTGDGATGFEPSRHVAACLCGSDRDYEQQGQQLHAELKNSGDAPILLAGQPTEWASQAIYLGCDVAQVLRDLHSTLVASEAAAAEGEA